MNINLIIELKELQENRLKMEQILSLMEKDLVPSLTISIPTGKVIEREQESEFFMFSNPWKSSEPKKEVISVTEVVDASILYGLASSWFKDIDNRINKIKKQIVYETANK